jgi:hypothetical protein
MTEQLLISAEPGAASAGHVATVIASLPISLAHAIAGTAVAGVAIAGTAGWTGRAIDAIDSGARGVVVVSPDFEPTAELERVARAKRVAVVIDSPWASNPAVTAARTRIDALVGELSFVDLVATVHDTGSFGPALAELRVLAGKLVGRTHALRTIEENRGSLLAAAALVGSDVPVTFHVLRAPAPEFAVRARVLATGGDIDLRIPDADTARPALLTTTDSTGSTLAPTEFESSHRHSWRRLLDHLATGRPADDLAEFAQAMTPS